jgi:hypothetical protein
MIKRAIRNIICLKGLRNKRLMTNATKRRERDVFKKTHEQTFTYSYLL